MTQTEALISGWLSVYGVMPTPLIQDTLQQLRKESWISVKDRMPEESGDVIVYCKDGYMCGTSYSKKHNAFNAHDHQDTPENAFTDVTYWRPMPDPPEGVRSWS